MVNARYDFKKHNIGKNLQEKLVKKSLNLYLFKSFRYQARNFINMT